MDKITAMALWEIERYTSLRRDEWDGFVAESRNGTFLLMRGYMDYHADRFCDCSLMAFKDGKLRALLPAELTADGVLHSHRGLTYGGWITPIAHFDCNDMLELWECWLQWCRIEGIAEIDYKPVPWIYSQIPAQEDLYALFRHGAEMTECTLSSAITYAAIRPFNTQQKRNLKKGVKSGCVVREEIPVSDFHRLLSNCLAERHDAAPVHNLTELQLLAGRFPDRIKFYGSFQGDKLIAGVCIFEAGPVAHCQYIASTAEGREDGALTLLFDYLIERYGREGFRYFDFGTSNEEQGRVLNAGLLRQKAALGGSGVAYTRYRVVL